MTNIKQKKSEEVINNSVNYLYSSSFLILYSIIGFIPEFDAIDRIGPQWLYLNSLSLLSTIYILKNNIYFSESIGDLLKTKFFWIYCAFVTWALFSIFYAINPVEVIVNLARVLGILIAFINVFILLHRIPNKLNLIAIVFALVLFIEMFMIFDPLLKLLKQGVSASRSPLLKGTTGNINIAAISLVIKIPFVLYLMNLTKKKWVQVFLGIFIFLTIICLVFIGSRASYLAIITIFSTYIIFNLYNFFKVRKSKHSLIPILYFALPFFIAIGVSEIGFINENNTSFLERSSTISQATSDVSITSRLRFYSQGFEHIISNPIIGSGLGNWKLISIFYDNEFINNYVVPYHMHNDFIQIGAELGIPGGLLYIGLFITLFIYIFYILKSKTPSRKKVFIVFVLISLLVYIIDALLNFPIVRPIMQIVFVLLLALVVSIFIDTTNANSNQSFVTLKKAYLLPLICLLLSIPVITVSFFTFESFIGQKQLITNFNRGDFSSATNVVENLTPSIPNISVTTLPIASIKARYYIDKGQDDEALKILRRDLTTNPYLGYTQSLMSKIFLNKGQTDSAIYYAKESYQYLPIAPSFVNYVNLLIGQQDTVEIKRIFSKDSIKHDPIVWKSYIIANNSLKSPGDSNNLRVINRAVDLFPSDKDFTSFRKESILGKEKVGLALMISKQGAVYFQEKDFTKAIEKYLEASTLDPLEYSYLENIAAAHFYSKRFEEAIPYLDKVINDLNPGTGKSEYIKALTLLNLNKNVEACEYFQKAKSFGYPKVNIFINTYCK